MRTHLPLLPLLVLSAIASSCGGDSGSGPNTDDNPTSGILDFEKDVVNLFETRSTSVNIVNGSASTIGPLTFGVGGTLDVREIDVGGVRGSALPPLVPEIRPGGKASVSINLNVTGLPSGTYQTIFEARLNGQARASMLLRFEVKPGSASSAVSVQITEGPAAPRQGDPVTYVADPRNAAGEQLPPAFVEWFVLPTGSGLLTQDGHFVPYTAGPARIIVRSGTNFDTLNINTTSRGSSGSLTVIGRGQSTGAEDVQVSGSFAYLGTSSGGVETWNVADPASPVLSSALELDAARVPSVHIRADGQLGAAAHVGSADGLNGVTLFDLNDPAAPAVVSRFTEGLAAGVVGVFLDGTHLYVAINSGGVQVIDVSDPTTPVSVGSFTASSSFATEVTVDDGLLYLAHWNAGSFVLDVGNGVSGGSPANPTLVASISSPGGRVGSMSIWKASGLAFLSEDDADGPGVVHFMDMSDFGSVSEVGSWGEPNLTPGPVAADVANQRLFAAWRAGGVRMLEATGMLEGKMELQGREVAVSLYDGAATNTVRVRVVGNLLFVADGSSGLVILQAG